MKAIIITEDNQERLRNQFMTIQDLEQIPVGHVLLAPFGSETEYDVVTKDYFDGEFVVVGKLENDYVEVEPL